MNKTTCVLALMTLLLPALFVCGCSTPVSLGISVAGAVVDDADVKDKAKELMGVSAARADEVLGPPKEVLRSDTPPREWRVYPMKHDLLQSHRYVAELADDRVVWFCKTQKNADIVLDAATFAFFTDKCKGNPAQVCQANIGQGPPTLSVRNVATGQLIQFYDARLVKDVQRPYYGVLRFGANGRCTEVSVVKIVASTSGSLAGE